MTTTSNHKVIGHIAGVPVVKITQLRIKNSEEKEGLYYYDLRESDDDFTPYSLEKFVMVNHFGTVVTTKPISKLEEKSEKSLVRNWIELTEDDQSFIFDNL